MPPKILFTFLAKALIFKNEALAVFSTALSLGLTPYLNSLLVDTDMKNIILPVMVFIIGSTLFFLHCLLDFLTGIYASKVLNERKAVPDKSYIKSYKLWSTLWKMIGVNLFCSVLCIISVGLEIVDAGYFYYFFMYAQTAVWLLACGFEFHSVGENIGKYNDSVSPIFSFIDKLLNVFQLRFLSSVNSVIRRKVEEVENEKIEPLEPEKTEENETT